ncbi:TPA: AzlC family ABC transporter permease [Streptococcus pneumoniae]|nr:AzlC family ABC transporter permease [Streptococcus pneumoniae]
MPTALGYVSIGLACGTIGAPYVTPVEMGLMSLFVYAGNAQFAMLALIVVQAPVAAIAMTVFLINLRLFLLSLHASTYFRHTSLWYNIGMSSILTDETYGVLMGELAHTDKVNPMWMHGNNLNSYVAWFVGTVVGTALGGLLPNPEIFALILSSVVTGKVGSLPQIKWLDFLDVFPTAWVAFRYRNLVGTVLFGVVLIAVLRLVF